MYLDRQNYSKDIMSELRPNDFGALSRQIVWETNGARSRAFRNAMGRLCKGFMAMLAQRVARHDARRHLESLDPYLLADIGLERDEIPAAVEGRLERPDPHVAVELTVHDMAQDIRNTRRRRKARTIRRQGRRAATVTRKAA